MNQWIETARREGRNLLEPEALALFEEYGLPVPRGKLAASVPAALAAAGELGYPVAMKIVSPDILHKSDVGGVKLNLQSPDEVEAAYHAILQNAKNHRPETDIRGILVVEMLERGLECITGMVKDASFGPAFMFGLGGVFVEVLQDVSFRTLPLDRENALAMVRELKAAALLCGTRGQPPKDLEAVAGLLLGVARMVQENPEIQELDINPCMVYEKGVMAADARVML